MATATVTAVAAGMAGSRSRGAGESGNRAAGEQKRVSRVMNEVGGVFYASYRIHQPGDSINYQGDLVDSNRIISHLFIPGEWGSLCLSLSLSLSRHISSDPTRGGGRGGGAGGNRMVQLSCFIRPTQKSISIIINRTPSGIPTTLYNQLIFSSLTTNS